MKKIILSLLAVGLIGGGIGYYQYNRPLATMSESKAAITTDAQTLFNAYEINETDANAKYNGKVVSVAGKVKEVTKAEKVTIVLETESAMSSVLCNLDPTAQHAKIDFQPGETVKIKGECTGFLMDVILERCIVE
jgi:tRNA_anti-like